MTRNFAGAFFFMLLLSLFASGLCLADQEKRWVVSPEGLYLRDAPAQTGKVIVLIPYRDEVRVLERQGNELLIQSVMGEWTRVEWNGRQGWVFGGFLKVVPQFEIVWKESETVFSYFSKVKNKRIAVDDHFLQKMSGLPNATIFRNDYFDLLPGQESVKEQSIALQNEYIVIDDFNDNGYADIAIIGFNRLAAKDYEYIIAIYEETEAGWQERYFEKERQNEKEGPMVLFFWVRDPAEVWRTLFLNKYLGYSIFEWERPRYKLNEITGD